MEGTNVNTEGGTSVHGNVDIPGDFVGRDQVINHINNLINLVVQPQDSEYKNDIVRSLSNIFDNIDITRYLEELEHRILTEFRYEYYVALSAEPIKSEDPTTLYALQRALLSSFDLWVEPNIGGGEAICQWR